MKEFILSCFRKIYPRNKESHKGDYGKIFVLAGSLGMTGAAYLCALSALRSGAGLVYLGLPESLNDIMEAKLTEVITIPLPETLARTLSLNSFRMIKEIARDCDSLAMGPGLSGNIQTKTLIRKVVAKLDKPILLDADAIGAFQGFSELLNKRAGKQLILTPHLGEFSRLCGVKIEKIKSDRENIVLGFAKKFNLTLVLKGYQTLVVSAEGDIYVNDSGNPGMATAGSGDVLCGIAASLRAQGLSDFEAASLGVYIHGRAGDIAAGRMGEISLIASDILESISFVFKELISI